MVRASDIFRDVARSYEALAAVERDRRERELLHARADAFHRKADLALQGRPQNQATTTSVDVKAFLRA